jgi:ribosomal protein S18 acetylase RimI-like enzyme
MPKGFLDRVVGSWDWCPIVAAVAASASTARRMNRTASRESTSHRAQRGRKMIFREMTAADQGPLFELLSRMRVSFVGCASSTVQRLMCHEASRRREVRCVVADDGGALVGLVIAVNNPRRYWRRFVVRHPMAALLILMSRLRSKTSPSDKEPSDQSVRPLLEPGPNEYEWCAGGANVAAIQFIGVAAEARRGGIGAELYETFFKLVASAGITRVDAHIEPWNVASVRLHRRVGYRVFNDGSGFYAIRELGHGLQ